jgi:hypothetical protein
VTNQHPDDESFSVELIEWEESWCSAEHDGDWSASGSGGKPAAIATAFVEKFVTRAGK